MRFGALGYNTYNLGDEIQSLAAIRFLPRVDHFVNRDLLGSFRTDDREPVAMILNGWYGHRPESWPPSEQIRPLLVSMHLSEVPCGIANLAAGQFLLEEPIVSYLREHGPVGARDLHTLSLLEKAKVPAYFSGCMTLTLQPQPGVERTGDVVLNDVPDEVVAWVRRRTNRNVVHTTHIDQITPPGEGRFEKAKSLLRLYQSAHCVITTRLHCFLPCLALGTPVLLLLTGQEWSRFPGLDALVRRCSVDDLLGGRSGFDIDHPEPNQDDHQALRQALEERATGFVAAAEADELPQRTTEIPAELRFHTLLHVHALQVAEMNRALADRTAERDRLQAEVQRLTAQRDEELRGLIQERDAMEQRLRETEASYAYRTAEELRLVAHRVPGMTRAARRMLDVLPGRVKR